MQDPFSISMIPKNSLFITCSSHEDRCFGILERVNDINVGAVIVFHYDDTNPKREDNHKKMIDFLISNHLEHFPILFGELNAVISFSKIIVKLKKIIQQYGESAIIFDISVFTKRHIFMMLRWLDDFGYLDKTTVVYSEPVEYEVTEFIPLSTGISSINPIPGFPSVPDLSRPMHLFMFLGFEGDRAIATYEHLQPMQTTLIVTETDYRESWRGKCEYLNADLINLVGRQSIVKVSTLDPIVIRKLLNDLLSPERQRSTHANIICPLGPKPQIIGIYDYIRDSIDQPAIVYTSPSFHNHEFFSNGTGYSWVLKR